MGPRDVKRRASSVALWAREKQRMGEYGCAEPATRRSSNYARKRLGGHCGAFKGAEGINAKKLRLILLGGTTQDGPEGTTPQCCLRRRVIVRHFGRASRNTENEICISSAECGTKTKPIREKRSRCCSSKTECPGQDAKRIKAAYAAGSAAGCLEEKSKTKNPSSMEGELKDAWPQPDQVLGN